MNQSDYARFLAESGIKVISASGIDWFEYSGFLRPAFLPHAVPEITRDNAIAALRQSNCYFARWDSHYASIGDSPWWYLVRKGPYDSKQLSQNTRSKLNRGKKKLTARLATIEEMREFGMQVCEKAAGRYGTNEFTPDHERFERKLVAASMFANTVEFFGVFANEQLVGFSENHIQENAVFLETIWYDPEYLGAYSSYLLSHEMLEYYLNIKGYDYVSDGCRSLYHDTMVQKFFAEKFGFIKESAILHLVYSPKVQISLSLVNPLRSLLKGVRQFLDAPFLRKLDGLIVQDMIWKECQSIGCSSGLSHLEK